MSRHVGLAFGFALLCAAIVPQNALAYCRTMACSDDPAFACSRDASGCLVNSMPLYWPTSCISFGIQEDGSRTDAINYATMRTIVSDAFAEWMNADCGGGQKPSFSLKDWGKIECDRRAYNSNSENANVFMFRDDKWPYENQQDTLALTTITFNVDTGEIYDADVEVNSFDADLTVDLNNPVADLPSIMTHEVGHFLGLSHSDVRGATMRPGYHPGDTGLRTLDPDDVAGICALYAPDRALPPAECEPRHGFSASCSGEEEGCATSPGQRSSAGALGLVALLGAAGLWRRRRARR